MNAQITDSTSITAGLTTATAGALSGTVTLAPISDASGTTTALAAVPVAVSGSVFRTATAQVAPVTAIVHIGDPGAVALTAAVRRRPDGQRPTIVTFGESADADVRIEGATYAGTGSSFRLSAEAGGGPVTLAVPGSYNVLNAAAAYAVSAWLGADEAEVAEEIREHGGWKHAVGELVTCPFCLAQWIGTGFVLSWVAAPRATRLAGLVMTTVAGAGVGQFLYDRLQSAVTGD